MVEWRRGNFLHPGFDVSRDECAEWIIEHVAKSLLTDRLASNTLLGPHYLFNVSNTALISLLLFVNLIVVPVLPFPTHLFFHPSLLPPPIHHSVHLQLPLSFTSGLKPTSFTNPIPVVLLLPPGLHPRIFAWAVSSELLCFWYYLFLIFCLWAVL